MSTGRRRRARGSLSREVILDAAVRALAHPDFRVTMRSLAEQLEADPTAVYRHFRGKDDLLGALTDRLLEPLADPAPASGWRDQLTALALELAGIFDRSPGAVAVLADGPFSPASVRALDATVSALLGHGLAPRVAAQACQAVVVLVIGHAATAAGDPAGFWSGAVDGAAAAGDHPALRATAEHWRSPPAEQLRGALGLLLDGIGVRAAGA